MLELGHVGLADDAPVNEGEALVSQPISLPNANGLHARPAAVFAQAAKGFKADIRLHRQQDSANGKSLVAIMAMGLGYHRQSEKRLRQVTADNDANSPVITSAGALVEALKVMKAKRIAIVAPYMKPLTELVVDYIREEGFEVVDWRALEIPDNLQVARHDPANLPDIVAGMNLEGVDVVVLSLSLIHI